MPRYWLLVAGLLSLAASPPPPNDVVVPGRQPGSADASNIAPSNTRTVWAPSLPAPMLSDDAPPAAFLQAAEHALAANHTGEAQEAMERAESRALDRSVRPSKAGQPSRQALVAQISRARQALANGDRAGALALVRAAAANQDANEPD
jgi:hypothetical protein